MQHSDLFPTIGTADPNANPATASQRFAHFATGYLRHIFGFIGISDLRVVGAGQLMADAEQAIGRAHDQIDAAFAIAA